MDRQDIDALLVGALYGELTPADEARLAAHLESHPTDRGALDDLKRARTAVRESRIFELQLEPPQAVSALLLQEAHRRAPKRAASTEETESWFYRFTRMFLAHPAMAAAAMLVLVVGVAGTLYLKKGDQFAEHAVTQEQPRAMDVDKNADISAVTTPTTPADQEGQDTAADTGSSYRVDLDGKLQKEVQQAETLSAATNDQAEQTKLEVARQRAAEKKKSTAIIVDRPRLEPKELDAPRTKTAGTKGATKDDFASSLDEGVIGGATGGGGGARGGAAGPARNAPSPPPPAVAATPAPAPTTTKPSKPSVTKEASKAEPTAPAPDNTLIAWAKGEHNRAINLARNGDCRAAAKLAVSVQNRAPEYYSQYMATDRALKNCQQYINAERDADAERSGKARSQKRVNADEAAPSQVK